MTNEEQFFLVLDTFLREFGEVIESYKYYGYFGSLRYEIFFKRTLINKTLKEPAVRVYTKIYFSRVGFLVCEYGDRPKIKMNIEEKFKKYGIEYRNY